MSNNRNLVDQCTEHIFQVKIPLPFPLRWVNAYLIKGDSGFTVIDPGIHTPDAVTSWHEALKLKGIDFSDIEQIVLTHHHPDHYGLAGWLQQETGAKVWMSEAGKRQVDYLWGDYRRGTVDLHALFTLHGMDSHVGDTLIEHMESFIDLVSPQPEVSFIHVKEQLLLGNQYYQPIHTPGHAYGHLMFYHEENGIVFCGDHVLPQITPNIGLMPGLDDNPLHSFLDSLQVISSLHVTEAYPGHRDPFSSFAERCQEIIAHHHDRLERLVAMIDEPRSAYELCLKFFGNKLSIHQLRFAMAETLAHLAYLREAGRLVEVLRGNVVYYRLAGNQL
jgi:glyoxylase-like metal-dependent hydrolase (beta-lactamase superfamily II)